jgi:hypothetical protein
MFEKIPFVLGWSADARIGRFKVKLSRLTTHEESAASDGGSYNAHVKTKGTSLFNVVTF